MECHSAIKRNELLISAATWMNPENMVLGEKKRYKRPHTVRFHLHEIPGTGKSRERDVVAGVGG